MSWRARLIVGELASRSLARAARRCMSTSPTPATLGKVDGRWLGATAARVGKCIAFGLRSDAQLREAGALCGELATGWRELVAGGEGFLTDAARRGLHRQQVVWGEMDSMGHVNNVMYVRYAESARVNWAANYARHVDPANRKAWENLWSPHGIGMILRSIKVDYKFPMTFPDRVTVYHKLSSLPEAHDDSFKLDVIILSEKRRRPVARCVEDVVMYDYRRGGKVTLDSCPFVLEAFRDTFKLQELAATKNREHALDIDRRARDLELGSWDRADAVENFGSAVP